jgi:hypothetical protein
MIVMHESASAYKGAKTVICSKCKRGKLASIPEKSEAVLSKRGKPPPDEKEDYVQVKCAVCRTVWILTIE